ncbi:Ribosomal protein S18 acetylase RimI [Catalinimonas alkaloidigena]|uniref:Ribosomal protein S18 acetylase RimI n=1 Tax=Catalinimonas alkaloidigena TaxID=1075417 RepID=A0A1G9S5Y6_9BACT|nr:GNAT family N-acetyltransferase [Catalinimonas alkaloidigena]SDM30801.1 Ribosomal protein S18 acetylase RimI [Catalinimonas alkaloidigena]
MTAYTLRPATLTDLSTIGMLAHDIWWKTYPGIISEAQIHYMLDAMYSEKALQVQLENGYTFLLLYEGAKPIGFVAYAPMRPDQTVRIEKIYLHPAYQGKRLGRKMIDEVATLTQRQGGKALELNVNRSNPAKGFYERCGFVITQEVDLPIGEFWMNDYIMRKELA